MLLRKQEFYGGIKNSVLKEHSKVNNDQITSKKQGK